MLPISVTTTNPYTGVNEIQLINNNSIEITIENQPFDYSNGYRIYFDVRAEPRFEGNGTEIYHLENLTSSYNADGTFSFAEYVSHDSPAQSNLKYTNITFPVVPTDVYKASGYDIQRYYTQEGEGEYFQFLYGIPYRGQVDFQVEALVGHDSQMWVIEHPFYPTIGGHFAPAIAYDAASDWSSTQTITIGESASTTTPTTSPSQSSTATPVAQGDTDQQGLNWTELSLFAALGVIVALLVVIALMYRKQTKK
jgi:hypothetical protein